jgi:hypothetical protein
MLFIFWDTFIPGYRILKVERHDEQPPQIPLGHPYAIKLDSCLGLFAYMYESHPRQYSFLKRIVLPIDLCVGVFFGQIVWQQPANLWRYTL